MPGLRSRRWSRRKIMIAVLASIGILAMVGTTLASLLMPFLADTSKGSAPRNVTALPTTTTPAVYLVPLTVRPVVQALMATPEQGPPGPPPPPPPPVFFLDTSNTERKAEYQLG